MSRLTLPPKVLTSLIGSTSSAKTESLQVPTWIIHRTLTCFMQRIAHAADMCNSVGGCQTLAHMPATLHMHLPRCSDASPGRLWRCCGRQPQCLWALCGRPSHPQTCSAACGYQVVSSLLTLPSAQEFPGVTGSQSHHPAQVRRQQLVASSSNMSHMPQHVLGLLCVLTALAMLTLKGEAAEKHDITHKDAHLRPTGS